MKLIILGANGATGRRIVARALEAGHDVTAMVRRADAETPVGAHRVVGDPLDAAQLATAAAGADAIISALGTRSMFGADIIQRGTAALIAAHKLGAPARVLIISAFGVGATADVASPFARMLYRTAMRGIYSDKEAAEVQLRASDLDWTLAYPGTLSNKDLRPYTATPLTDVTRVPGLPSSTRDSVADFLVGAVGNPDWSHASAVLRDS